MDTVPQHFTSVEILAIGSVLVAVLTAIGSIIVNIITSLRVAKVAAVAEKIAVSVDGATTAAADREAALRKEIEFIREVLADKKKETEKLLETVTAQPAAQIAAPVDVKIVNTPEQSVPVTPVAPEKP